MTCNSLTKTDRNFLLERNIDHRTGSRVHEIRVEDIGDRIVVHGHADSYYALQLAIVALQESIQRPDDLNAIDLDIEVGSCPASRCGTF